MCVRAHVCVGMWRPAVCQVSSSIAFSIIIIIVVVAAAVIVVI